MARSNMQAAFEDYLMEHGECDSETFKRLQSIFEGKDEGEEEEPKEDNESEDEGDDSGLDLDEDTQKVYDQFKELSKDQQKAFCQAQRTEKLYQEFAELSDEDKEFIREGVGEDVDNLDNDTFLDVMEACINAVNEVNAGTYVAESGEDSLDNLDFLK